MQKVAWMCTYVPEEIISAAGYQPIRLLPGETSCRGQCKMLPANFCPYVRQLAEGFEKGVYKDIAGIIIANSCDPAVHLYNVLNATLSQDQFVYLLDLPRKQDESAYAYFAIQLYKLYCYLYNNQTYHTYHKKVNEADDDSMKKELGNIDIENSDEFYSALYHALTLYQETQQLFEQIDHQYYYLSDDLFDFTRNLASTLRSSMNREIKSKITSLSYVEHQPVIMLSGGIITDEMYQVIKESSPYWVVPENCIGFRYLYKLGLLNNVSTDANDVNIENSGACELNHDNKSTEYKLKVLFYRLASVYLDKPACPRIFSNLKAQTSREMALRQFFSIFNVKAIIHHDLGFCDLANYDYLISSQIYEQYGYPYLRINSELGDSELSQMRTRLEAFFETSLI